MRKWVAIGPAPLLETLAPLAEEHRRLGDVELVEVSSSSEVSHYVRGASGPGTTVVIVESPSEPSARGQFRSPFVRASNGSTVCVSYLRLDEGRLGAYATRAATLLNRPAGEPRAVVLLAPREQRYLQLLTDLERLATPSEGVSLFRWSAERIRRAPLAGALKLGAAAILFSGHGTVRGWYAYGGMSAKTLVGAGMWGAEQSSSVMFSLACSTGSTASTGSAGAPEWGFADAVVANGVAGAVLAPVGDPLHANNRVLARALMHAMSGGSSRVRQALEQAAKSGASLDGFVVIGDPELPMHSATGAVERGEAVFAPPAGAVLVPRCDHWSAPPPVPSPSADSAALLTSDATRRISTEGRFG